MRTRLKTVPELRRHLRHHLQALNGVYSKILPMRFDLYYDKDSAIDRQRSDDFLTCDIREFINLLEYESPIIGYAWVMEYTQDRGVHFHVIVYFNGQTQRSTVGFDDIVIRLWDEVTDDSGIVHICTALDTRYQVNALRQIHYHDKEAQAALFYALDYLAKESQKILSGYRFAEYGLSEVPERSNRGRRREYSIPYHEFDSLALWY